MNDDKIINMLERYGAAMSAGNLPAISSCWAVPALVLSDDGALAVTNPIEIEAFFAQGIEYYRSQGLSSTRPELERVEMLSDTLASVDVRWPAYDSSGEEKSSERSHYILQFGGDGQIRIRVALTRTV
jgi:hypothetical protein